MARLAVGDGVLRTVFACVPSLTDGVMHAALAVLTGAQPSNLGCAGLLRETGALVLLAACVTCSWNWVAAADAVFRASTVTEAMLNAHVAPPEPWRSDTRGWRRMLGLSIRASASLLPGLLAHVAGVAARPIEDAERAIAWTMISTTLRFCAVSLDREFTDAMYPSAACLAIALDTACWWDQVIVLDLLQAAWRGAQGPRNDPLSADGSVHGWVPWCRQGHRPRYPL